MTQGQSLKVNLIKSKLFWFGLVFSLLLDQISKFWVMFYEQVTINNGVSWGWLDDVSVFILVGVQVLMLGVLIKYFYSIWVKHPLLSGLFLGSSFSNMIDRILFGGVRDWMMIPILKVENNAADFLIVGSLALLAIQIVKENNNLNFKI